MLPPATSRTCSALKGFAGQAAQCCLRPLTLCRRRQPRRPCGRGRCRGSRRLRAATMRAGD